MSNAIQIPHGCTHAAQANKGQWLVVKAKNLPMLDEKKPIAFGTFENCKFEEIATIVPEKPKRKQATKAAKKTAKAAQTPAQAQDSTFFTADGKPTVGGVVVEWTGRRAHIAKRIFEGKLKAPEIAQELMDLYAAEVPGYTYEKALAHVRATPPHLKQVWGIKASYVKKNGGWNPPALWNGGDA